MGSRHNQKKVEMSGDQFGMRIRTWKLEPYSNVFFFDSRASKFERTF